MANTVSVRISDELNDRLMKQVTKENCTKTEFVLIAIEMAIDRGEREARHTPAAVTKALPQRMGSGVILPDGIQFDRWPNG